MFDTTYDPIARSAVASDGPGDDDTAPQPLPDDSQGRYEDYGPGDETDFSELDGEEEAEGDEDSEDADEDDGDF